MHHDDLMGRGTYPHWVLDNLLPGGTGHVIDDALCLESALTAPGSGTAAARTTWDSDYSLYQFPNAAAKKMQTIVQLPHSYENGTDLAWHVHFIPQAAIPNGQTVQFSIGYRAAALYDAFSATVTATTTFTSTGTTAADTHQKTQTHAIIDGSGLSGSSFIIATITRTIADTYTGDVLILGADYHISKNRLGSYAANPTTEPPTY